MTRVALAFIHYVIVCSHAVLMTMLFDPDFELPESLEEAIPTARKLALKRGITGTKCKRYLAARAAELRVHARKPRNSVLWGLWYDMSLLYILPSPFAYST